MHQDILCYRTWSLQKDKHMSQGLGACGKKGRTQSIQSMDRKLVLGNDGLKGKTRIFLLSLRSSYLSDWSKWYVCGHPTCLTWHSKYSVLRGGRTKVEKEWGRSVFAERRWRLEGKHLLEVEGSQREREGKSTKMQRRSNQGCSMKTKSCLGS